MSKQMLGHFIRQGGMIAILKELRNGGVVYG
jgi:hypothetical protein